MFNFEKLSKPEIKKYAILTSVSVLLILSFILLIAAWSNNVVTIHDGENVISVKTKMSTVSDVLEEAGISLGNFDSVDPERDAGISNNMSITVLRAVKVSVSDEGKTLEYMSSGQTVEAVLNQTGYTLAEGDVTVPAKDSAVSPDMLIEIRRAKEVIIIDDNGERKIKSAASTVSDLLSELGVSHGGENHVNLPASTGIKEGMKIKISSVSVEYEEVEETIPYKTENRNNSSLAKGTSKVARAGKNGVKVVTYEVKYKDGVEIERNAVNTEIKEDAVTKIVDIGTKAKSATPAAKSTSSSGTSSQKGFSYSKVLTCSASAYDLSYESCGKHPGDPNYGITASGMRAQYGVVAVDPRVIPLGTRLYIEAVDGSWTYGYCVAGDTGGGIKGNKVDLFYNSRAEAINFGRRQAKVYILN